MSALPFLHDRQFSPRLTLVCLVCLLLLPACPAPGSDLDGTAHNHHAQIRAGDAYSNVYGVMAYGDSARARYGTVVNDGGQAVQAFGGWCYGGVADTAYNSIVVNGGRISDNAYGGSALATMFARSNSNTVLQIGGDVSHIVGGNADSGNSLNLLGWQGTLRRVAAFQYLNLALPNGMRPGETLLTLGNEQTGGDLQGGAVRVLGALGGQGMRIGDRYTLINSIHADELALSP